jgi:hypothetical protein
MNARDEYITCQDSYDGKENHQMRLCYDVE